MTKFEDRLFGELMTEHGHYLHAAEPPGPARRLARRPVWLVTGTAGGVAAAAAAMVALGSSPASAAYSVTRHPNGTVTVAVNRLSGVAGANGTLHKMHARIRVVRVRPGCRPIGSLPRPHPAPHPSVKVASKMAKNGHRSVTVTLGNGGIPKGDTMILAFSGNSRSGTALGVGGIITGHVPHCVSLPPPP
jgi:hypothetical protein